MPNNSSTPSVVVTCRHCGAEFRTWPSVLRKGAGTFCSGACADAGRLRTPRAPERRRQSNQRHKTKNREQILEGKRQYRERHLAEERERNRQWRAQNSDYLREKGRAWRQSHPGEGVENKKRWRINNPERAAAASHAAAANRRAREAGMSGHISTADVVALWERQPVCVQCGKDRGIDHIVEFWQGGPNTPDNLQNLCRHCKAKKTARLRFGTKGQAAA